MKTQPSVAKQVARGIMFAAILLLGPPLLGWVVLYAWQVNSSMKAERLLAKLEAMRIGTSRAEFEAAINESGAECKLSTGCSLSNGPWNIPWFRDHYTRYIAKTGLRYWQVRFAGDFQDDALQSVTAFIIVDGRDGVLGCDWYLRENLTAYADPGDGRPTVIRRSGLLDIASGVALELHLTPPSSEADFRARSINPECLRSFGGCVDLGELLPNARLR